MPEATTVLPFARATPPIDAAARARLDTRRRALIAEAAANLLKGEDPDAVILPRLYASLSAEFAVDASIGFAVADQAEGLTLRFARGLDPAAVSRCLRLDFGQAVCGTVAATGRPIYASNIQRSLDPLTDLVRGLGINAYACEPLLGDEGVLGTLSFGTRSRAAFEAADLEFFAAVARIVAAARSRRPSR